MTDYQILQNQIFKSTSSTKAKKTIPDRHFTPEPSISMTEPEVNNSGTQISQNVPQNVPQIDSGAENPLFRNVTQVEDLDDDYTSAESYIEKMSEKLVSPVRTHRRLPSLAVAGKSASRRLIMRKTSVDSNTILERLDSLEGVVSGLQGGIIGTIESVDKFRRNTEKCIENLSDKTMEALDKIQSMSDIFREEQAAKNDSKKLTYDQIDEISHKTSALLLPAINLIKDELADIRNSLNQQVGLGLRHNNVEMTDKAVSPITKRSAPAVKENSTDDLDNIPVEETIAPTKPPSAKRGFNVNKPEDKLNNNKKDDKTSNKKYEEIQFSYRDKVLSQKGVNTDMDQVNNYTKQGTRKTLLIGDSTTNLIDRRKILRE